MDPITSLLIIIGGLTLIAGFGGSLLPLLPGPPLTALGNLLIQIGLVSDGQVSVGPVVYCPLGWVSS